MGMVGNGFYQLPCDNDARPLIGSYDLSKLITINGCSFNEKTIHLELNNDFIKAAQQLDEYHQNVRNQLEGY
jgi:hypothetical protein